jgi:hypothetical protein
MVHEPPAPREQQLEVIRQAQSDLIESLESRLQHAMRRVGDLEFARGYERREFVNRLRGCAATCERRWRCSWRCPAAFPCALGASGRSMRGQCQRAEPVRGSAGASIRLQCAVIRAFAASVLVLVASIVEDGLGATLNGLVIFWPVLVLAAPAYLLEVLPSRLQRRLQRFRLPIPGTQWQLRLPFESR